LIDNRERVIAVYEGGMTCREVWQAMPELGISRDATIASALREWGVQMRPRRPRQALTGQQEAQVVELYRSGLSAPQIIERLGLSASVGPIHALLDRAGIDARDAGHYKKGRAPVNKRLSDEMEGAMVEAYLGGRSAQRVADDFGFKTDKTVLDVLHKRGVAVKEGSRDYALDSCWHEAFADVQTEEQAYWLGMLITDGWISKASEKDAWQVGLQLKESDLAHIEKFKAFLKSDSKISRVKKIHEGKTYWMYRLMVNSRQMKRDLEKYGVVERKSDKTFLPELRPDLMRHLLRGILDGDGCIFRSYGVLEGVTFSGSECLVRTIAVLLNATLGVAQNKVRGKGMCKSHAWAAREDVSRILNFLYNDCHVALERKFSLYKEWFDA
jgi:transposase